MRCPECGAEYVDGIDVCADCDAPLVEHSEPVAAAPEPDFRSVFMTGSSDEIAIAKSLLLAAGIEFMVKGEDVQDLFGWGRFPAVSNVVVGPMEIFVAAADAEEAAALLSGLHDGAAQPEAIDELVAPDDDVSHASFWTAARPLGRFVVILILGIIVLEVVVALLAAR